MTRPYRTLRLFGLLMSIAVWSFLPFSAEAGSMPPLSAQLPAPLSTAKDLTTLEGFAGAVGLFSASGADSTHCLATLVSRNVALTSFACGVAHGNAGPGSPPKLYFPQAGLHHQGFGVADMIHIHGIQIVTLDGNIPEHLVEKIPAMFLGGRLNKGRRSLERLDLEGAATFSFLDMPQSLQTRFASPLTAVEEFSFTVPFQFGSGFPGPADSLPKIEGAPLVVRDTSSGEYVVFGIHNDLVDLGDGSSMLYWRSIWNPDIQEGGSRWQHGDWILSELGPDRDLDGRPDGYPCEGENCDQACICPFDDVMRPDPCDFF